MNDDNLTTGRQVLRDYLKASAGAQHPVPYSEQEGGDGLWWYGIRSAQGVNAEAVLVGATKVVLVAIGGMNPAERQTALEASAIRRSVCQALAEFAEFHLQRVFKIDFLNGEIIVRS